MLSAVGDSTAHGRRTVGWSWRHRGAACCWSKLWRHWESGRCFYSCFCVHFWSALSIITGLPTRSVGARLVTVAGICRRRLSVSVIVVCNIPRLACRRLQSRRIGDDIMPTAVYVPLGQHLVAFMTEISDCWGRNLATKWFTGCLWRLSSSWIWCRCH